jgi:glycosyltransferase involved in cell wall biosynthesis
MYYQDCINMVESLKIKDNFTFTGRQNVLEYYSFLDVLLLTSVREAQPLVILEAYIAGVPVVATRVGNIPEMLSFDDRLLAPSKGAEKLAEGIRFIHDNPEEVEQMKIRNREMVFEKYNRKDLHKRYLGIYTSYGEK